MSAPDYSQVYRFQTVQDTSVSLTVSARGAAAHVFLQPAFQEQLMDRIQREIGSQVPGAFPPERRDDGAERGYMLDSHEAEHSIRQPPTEHHAAPPYVCDSFLASICFHNSNIYCRKMSCTHHMGIQSMAHQTRT
jgi:hypothetical protein